MLLGGLSGSVEVLGGAVVDGLSAGLENQFPDGVDVEGVSGLENQPLDGEELDGLVLLGEVYGVDGLVEVFGVEKKLLPPPLPLLLPPLLPPLKPPPRDPLLNPPPLNPPPREPPLNPPPLDPPPPLAKESSGIARKKESAVSAAIAALNLLTPLERRRLLSTVKTEIADWNVILLLVDREAPVLTGVTIVVFLPELCQNIGKDKREQS